MEGDLILNFVAGLHPTARLVLTVIGLVCAALVAGIVISPWKGDDEALEKIRKMPVIGGLIAALMKFSPLSPKEEKKPE